MTQRKISECINLRINLGTSQHIELSKYAEEEIEFVDKADLIKKEDSLRDDLVASLRRSLEAIPEMLGHGKAEAVEIQESIQTAIPEWLEKGSVPNIANVPKARHMRDTVSQKAEKDTIIENEIDGDLDTSKAKTPEKAELPVKDELFEEDVTETKVEEVEKKVEVNTVEEDEFGGFDDDFFDA